MSYSRKNRRRVFVIGLLAVLGLLAFALWTAAKNKGSGDLDNNGSKSSAGLKATAAPSASAMDAVPAATCQDLVDTASIEFYTIGRKSHANGTEFYPGNKSLKLRMVGSNSAPSAKKHYEDFCEYRPAGSKDIVAQTSYQVFTARGVNENYKPFYDNKVDYIRTAKVPNNRLPIGVDDGYYFSFPASAEPVSVYRHAGVTLRSGNQLATVSFKGFDKLSATEQRVFLANAAVVLTH